MQGSISERFTQYTAASGGPWITRNEVRSKENLPPIEGGDDLIVPLNVAKEGEDSPALPAPNVMPIQDPNKPPQDGSYREQPKSLMNGGERDLIRIIDHHYDRQEAKVLTTKSTEVVRAEHWRRELADDIRAVFGEDVNADKVANGITNQTLRALDGTEPRKAYEQLRSDAERWASDIDRARVMLVAASLLDASEGE